MAWDELLARLRDPANADATRLADLLEMDLQGHRNQGAEGTQFGGDYGDHIPPEAQSQFQADLQGLLAGSASGSADLCRTLAELFSRPTLRSFELDCNGCNRCGKVRARSSFRAIRYVPLDRFLKFFLREEIDGLPRVPDPDRSRAASDRLRRAVRRLEGLSPPVKPSLARADGDGRVWVTQLGSAPHELGMASGMPLPDICSLVVQRMGLTGFDTPDVRSERIGMVALEYVLDPGTTLYRPTVLDAFPQLAFSPSLAFYPAPKGKDHGETLPLDDTLQRSGPRSVAGHPEWIHSNTTVQLRGDGITLSNAWHGRVAWWGTW